MIQFDVMRYISLVSLVYVCYYSGLLDVVHGCIRVMFFDCLFTQRISDLLFARHGRILDRVKPSHYALS